jgi:hypothetical protein
MVAAADDYFGMFAAAPQVRTPFASPCDRWENGMFATAGGTALPGEDGKAAPMRPHDCSPKGLVISSHGPWSATMGWAPAAECLPGGLQ